ncbi:phage shock protein operon transcriptional activator [Tanticharoenia sakaeratensis]|uniref:PSP operon transcriptional activator PspF n=1 Tax=Tanticharoenia sakaeratensis NBRC 103193 TaxID=1231623 RepID=A0A0D6MN06_9PROT|nr:phage shock protein operon transcriptional activator [Tanticharoenia sakaeratensis]GAN54816.1 PSP operon transcriptional activator PspF [Tanticharoenia sakaeratensis NBRC 103193]GBQ21471.1 PSP operon transcriptional activator PspF [Tanticharoenia sakaeratensis NBRC 103193]
MVELAESFDVPTPIGQAPSFLAMLDHVSRLAPLDRSVLVIGERGTGKELIAARLALLSGRWDKPLIKLNCAALSESLLDSELFGHEAGSFTGAQRRRLSRFERANHGTLFLDEIATASLAVQEKLLRVIEYGSFERVGGNETIEVDVRVVGATNADLPAMAAKGTFRADLLDRLAFDVVAIPPLRDRPTDIPILAEHFARRMTAELDRKLFAGFAPGALRTLMNHDWPGNVRELRNVIERSVYRMERTERPLDEIILDPFRAVRSMRPLTAPAPSVPEAAAAPVARPDPSGDGETFTDRVRNFERRMLEDALMDAQFSQRRAAEILGLTYYQFRHHLRLHGLADKRARAALGSGQPSQI